MKKEFLDLLAEKLNTGSMRNIYLNTLPSRYKARMDFFDIDILKNALSDEFFTNLFSEEKFELRTKLKMEMLKSHLSKDLGKKFEIDIKPKTWNKYLNRNNKDTKPTNNEDNQQDNDDKNDQNPKITK